MPAKPCDERKELQSGLPEYGAVALFIERVRTIKPDFQLTPANARAVVDICVRLDGLPLAIELAAAPIRLLSPQQLLARLGQSLQVLTGGTRDLTQRQQTMRNTIKWSYDLLSPEEQKLFRRLAVFVGGCTVEAAEAEAQTVSVALGEAAVNVLDAITSLIDKHLLWQREHKDEEAGEVRLFMLETIREYGTECLQTAGETEVTQSAHANYYLALVVESEPNVFAAE